MRRPTADSKRFDLLTDEVIRRHHQDDYGPAAYRQADIGDFHLNLLEFDAAALRWLEGYESAFGSGCGTCLESRDRFSHLFRTARGCGLLAQRAVTPGGATVVSAR